VVGLFLSGFAAVFAKSASTAAKESRQAVLLNSLSEEINLAQKLAAEITNLIDLGKHELVRLRSSDLHDRTLTILNRWDKGLSNESKNNLRSAKAQLDSLRTQTTKLTAAGVAPSPRQLNQMQDSCSKIRDIFVEEHASAMRRIDEADNA
jgi:hypothetical protein